MYNAIFQNKKPDEEKLLAYGFAGKSGKFVFSADLLDGQFTAWVEITEQGVSSKVFDNAAEEEYVLHRIPGAAGAFVGSVREAHDALLSDICGKCFANDVFKTVDAGRIIDYIRDQYACGPEYLWEKFPKNAVFRRADNGKWFAALLTVKPDRLGLAGEDEIEILDLRARPEDIPALVDGKHFFPGWHMNKKHWFTVCLDGSVPQKELFEMIDQSYILALKKQDFYHPPYERQEL